MTLALSPDDVRTQWWELRKRGELKDTDVRILELMLTEPGITNVEIGKRLSMTQLTVANRLKHPVVIKARAIMEGSISDQMMAAAHKFARWLNGLMDLAETDVADLVREAIDKSQGDPQTAKALMQAALAKIDPRVILEAGKMATGFLIKEAEMQAESQKGTRSENNPMPSTEEAIKILEADFVNNPAEPVIIEDI